MIRALALSAIFATPAFADDRAWWGASPDPDQNVSVTLAPADAPAVATVTFRNRLIGVVNRTTATLDIPGLSVGVEVIHGPGDAPDTLTVTPPDGYIAVPPFVDVDENAEGVIVIYSADGVGA